MLWLGIDVGGTFTDLVLYDEATGAIRLEKTPSTPRDHAEGMMTGIGRLTIALDRVSPSTSASRPRSSTFTSRHGCDATSLRSQPASPPRATAGRSPS